MISMRYFADRQWQIRRRIWQITTLATAAALLAGCTATTAPGSSASNAATAGAAGAAATSAASQEVSAGSVPIGPPAGSNRPTVPPGGAGGAAPIPHCAHPAPEWDQVTTKVTEHAKATEGYASVDSATAGTPVDLYVSTPAKSFRIDAYRMGFYGKAPQACAVWRSAEFNGGIQPSALILATVHEPTAPWRRSLTVPTAGWQPGNYLLRIDGGTPAQRSFIPLTIRSASFAGRVVLVMPDTTWQAYNTWGGYSLYFGPDHRSADRARIVSFDRPYGYGQGAADFVDDDLPLVTLAESIGIPLGYATDVDLQRDPAAFRQARAIISVGHDEYYSPTMRDALTLARDAGVNLGFLGANDIYRKIRFADSPIGTDRRIINYKDATDPIKTPSLVTTQWRETPSNNPESSLTGADYRCASSVYYPMVVADPTNWLFTGTGVQAGTKLPGVVGQEFDGINIARPVPRPLTVLFHSPVICTHRPTSQDSTYYTTPSGAGVLDIGAYYWNCAIARRCPAKIDGATSDIVTRITTNFLTAAAAGPLGKRHPAVDNVRTYYPRPRVGN